MDIRNLAWKNLRRRKSRAVFTGLGIFLGIGTFVALSTLSSRMEGAIQDKLDRFGIRLCVDAIELCYSKEHIDTFVIVSGAATSHLWSPN